MSKFHSCIYRGMIRHRRRTPVVNAFKFPSYMMYVDLEELDEIFSRRLLWSTSRPAPARFKREAHLKKLGSELSLREAVIETLRRNDVETEIGPIRLLTQFRHFGFEMNPVSFFYCFAVDGNRVEAVIAEVNNTPWGEQHVYVMPSGDDKYADQVQKRVVADRVQKAFHVSPFLPMDMEYRMLFSIPDRQLGIKMQNFQDGERKFDVSVLFDRVPITVWSLNWILIRYPLMTVQVFAGIYWQALKLYLRGVPVFSHSKTKKSSEVEPVVAGQASDSLP